MLTGIKTFSWAIVKANGGGKEWVGWRYGIRLDRSYFWAIVKANGGGKEWMDMVLGLIGGIFGP